MTVFCGKYRIIIGGDGLNDMLVKYYLSMPDNQESKKRLLYVNCDIDYISFLNNSGIQWTYEIESQEVVNGAFYTSITLYLPKIIRPGVGCFHSLNGDFRFKAIEKAIENACKSLNIGVGLCSRKTEKANPVREEELTEDEVATTSEQPESGDKKNNHGFSEKQVKDMNDFKTEYGIENDTQFLSYLRTWDPNIESKAQVTPDNIDIFLAFIKYMDNGET